MRLFAVLSGFLALLLTPAARAACQAPTSPAQDSATATWRIDSGVVNPVFGRRRYEAYLGGTESGGLMLLVCDAEKRLYVQFFVRPIRQSPSTLAGLPATHIAYRFDEEDPVTGRIVWQEDQPDVGNALWHRELRAVGGLDSRPFWHKLRAGRMLLMSFQGVNGELFVRWALPSNTDSVVRVLRNRCDR